MKRLFPTGSKDSYKGQKKDEDYRQIARETDPLLSIGTHPSQRGSVRSRRMSQSSQNSSSQHESLTEPIISPTDEMSASGGSGSSEQCSQEHDDLLQQRQNPEPLDRPYLFETMSSPVGTEEGEGSSLQSRHSRPSTKSDTSKRSDNALPAANFMPVQNQEDARSLATNTTRAALLEIPEEIYALRKAALQVLKPLTKTWIVISVGFSLTVLFGMARWTRLLPGLPFWFVLLPSWSAHGGLVFLHVRSAQALSTFIAEANESRQRPDSRDHLNRTEYLPLLQRSLKFGLKTGILSFIVFVFEILIYVRLAHNTMPLTVVFIPLWLLVLAGIADGLICKTQHGVRVLCWLLTFSAMILLVLKLDYGFESIRWRVVISPIVLVLSIASGSLIYIVYGHQVGYYQLTESQLTAGNLYSLAALICIVLVVMIGEVIPLSRPVEVETRLFVVVLAPLVVCLVGMGAWVVSRDEFGRLLLYGGQAAVHPMKLRWEANGWASFQGKGVTVMPMFGEVSFRPLRRDEGQEAAIEMCVCCSGRCYPYEEEDENPAHMTADIPYHPYLDPSQHRSAHYLHQA